MRSTACVESHGSSACPPPDVGLERASGNAFWNFDPTTLVINDGIHACVVKNRLRLIRPDGKDYSTKIVRTIRESSTAEPSIR
jgi:hypothetical protein